MTALVLREACCWLHALRLHCIVQPLTELLASLAPVPASILPSPEATLPTGCSLTEEGQMDLTVDNLDLTQCLMFGFSHTNQADWKMLHVFSRP